MAEKSFIDTDDEMSNKACGPAALNSWIFVTKKN